MKKLLLILCIVMLVALPLVAVGCTEKTQRTQFVYQDTAIFNADQVAAIEAACKETTAKRKATFLVFTCDYDDVSAKATYSSAESAMSHFGIEPQKDYCVVVVSIAPNGNYHFYLDTVGNADRKVKQGEIDDIVFSSDGDKIAMTTDLETVTAGVVGVVQQFGIAYQVSLFSVIIVIVVALGIGLGVMLIIAGRIKRSYSIKRRNEVFDFDSNSRLDLKQVQDVFVRSNTTYVIISSDSGHSGGGGGHSSAGGGGGGRGGR